LESTLAMSLFARSSFIDACGCLRRVAENAGVERPELIRSTKLRKYVATVSQLLDMSENELELLCRHMGHSINIHRDFYRLPSSTLELAKISKLLLAIGTGKLGDLSGRKFAELDDIPDVADEEESENEVTDRDDEDDANTAVNKDLNDCAASQTDDDQLGDSEHDVEPVNSTDETKRMKKKMRKDRRTAVRQ